MREILELESDVMELGAVAANEIDRVMIGVAAQEDEEVADPVRHPEAEDALIEVGRVVWARRDEGDMAELQRARPKHLLVSPEIAPFREQLDRRALVVLERQHPAHPGDRIVA